MLPKSGTLASLIQINADYGFGLQEIDRGYGGDGMMSFAAFASAVLALLLSPGPTNVLMALAGAQGGRVE